MARLRANPPATLLGRTVEVTDLATDPDSPNDVVILRFDGGRVVVRPSGTEPKCKAYLEVIVRDGRDLAAAEATAASWLDELTGQLSAILAF